MPSTLQRSDYEDCLVAFYFGRGTDRLQLCMRRAYGDFKRRLHGIQEHPQAPEVRKRADGYLGEMFSAIREMQAPTQEQFDDWHRQACLTLSEIYREYDYRTFLVGHGQKWINMTLKYIYVMGDEHIRAFGHLYDLCHVPFDSVLINALQSYGFKPLPCAWSKLNDYDIYLDRQRWVRNRFDLPPLDVEFRLWIGQPLR